MQLLQSARNLGLDVTVTGRPSAEPLASLAEPSRVTAAVDVYAEHHWQMFGDGVRRDISALWLLQDVAWAHAVLSVGLVRSTGHAAYAASGLHMHFPRDMVFAVEISADDLDVHEVDDLRAAYGVGRNYLSRLLAPIVQAFLPELRSGPRAAWACVTDAASSVVSGEYDAKSLEAGLRLFTDQAAGDDQLLTGTTIVASPSGPIRRRNGCCLLYAIDGMDLCFSCPRLPKNPARPAYGADEAGAPG